MSAALVRLVSGLLRGPGPLAITGPAGAGKSFIASAMAAGGDCAVYSADFRFIGDSTDRRNLLTRKQAKSAADYQDSANQFNWWDWPAIERDLQTLAGGAGVELDAAYDRDTGLSGTRRRIEPARRLLFEGALLGPPQLVSRFRQIVFVCTPAQTRFARLVAKDAARRSFNEILARFLITEYSETIYYRNLFAWAADRMSFVDAEKATPCPQPELPGDLFVPLRVGQPA